MIIALCTDPQGGHIFVVISLFTDLRESTLFLVVEMLLICREVMLFLISALFTVQQGGLKLKIAALKVTKKTATKDNEVRKVSASGTKVYGKEKPTQVQAVTRLGAKTSSSKKLECRKKLVEARDSSKAHGVGRTLHRDKVLCLHVLLICVELLVGGVYYIM
jgi:hypothetical protein